MEVLPSHLRRGRLGVVKGLILERKPREGDDVDAEEGWPLGKIDGKGDDE